jgi:hypothetical protein
MVIEYSVLQSFDPFLLGYCNCGCDKNLKTIKNSQGKPSRFIKGHWINTKHIQGKSKPYFKTRNNIIFVYAPNHPNKDVNNHVLKHRLIYEHYLSILMDEEIYLSKYYDVRHLNGDHSDNRLINLELISHSENRRNHMIKDMSKRFCRVCGKNKTCRQKNKSYFLWYGNEKEGWLCNNCYTNRLRLIKNKNTRKIKCVFCRSDKSYVIKKSGKLLWYGNEKDGRICRKCYQRVSARRKKYIIPSKT